MLNNYENKLIGLKQRLSKSAWQNHRQMLNAYAFFSANVTHFMPEVPPNLHQKWFNEAILNRQWNRLDESFFNHEHPFVIKGWDPIWMEQLRERPGLICTFHTGSYRLINYLLYSSRIPLALLVGEYAFSGRQLFFDKINEHSRFSSEKTYFSTLNATDPKVALKMKKALEQGINVLTYLDGYQGTQDLTDMNALRIPFLAQHQLLRKGLPYLAYKLNVPIYTLCCFREVDNSLRYVWLGPFEKKDMTLPDFMEYTLYKIYNGFSSYVQHYPTQWQNWSSLHLYANRNDFFVPAKKQPKIVENPNKELHALLALRDDFFLLDKLTYKAYQIPKPQFDFLHQLWYN